MRVISSNIETTFLLSNKTSTIFTPKLLCFAFPTAFCLRSFPTSCLLKKCIVTKIQPVKIINSCIGCNSPGRVMTSYCAKVPILFPYYILDVGCTAISKKRRNRSISLHEMKIHASTLLFLNLCLLE